MAKIGDLIKQSVKPFFSLEYFPPSEQTQLDSFYQTVETLGQFKPLFISVTYGAGGAKQQNTLAVTSELARRGYNTMAHLTCVGAEARKIKDFALALNENGVHNILALRGDPPANTAWDWNQGEFRHASDLVRFIHSELPDMGVGVAAYPAPHPESSSFSDDRKYTAEKLKSGADFAITQLFFDPREYAALVQDLKERHIDVPIIPGLMTIQSFEGLKRVLSLCGANIPGKLYIQLEEANARGGAKAVREAGLKFTLNQIRQLLDMGAPGIHLYTLNKSNLCTRIIEECGLKQDVLL